MLKGISLVVLWFGLLFCVCTEDHEDHAHSDHGTWTLDPYHEVLGFLNITEEKEFTMEKLDILIEDLNERLRCEDEEDDEHEHDDDDNDGHGLEIEQTGGHGDNTCNKTIVRISPFQFNNNMASFTRPRNWNVYVIKEFYMNQVNYLPLCEPAPIAQLVEYPLQGTEGHGFNPGPRHTGRKKWY